MKKHLSKMIELLTWGIAVAVGLWAILVCGILWGWKGLAILLLLVLLWASWPWIWLIFFLWSRRRHQLIVRRENLNRKTTEN